MFKKSKITIIRGLPGSGKSLLARKLAAERNIIHISPDILCSTTGDYLYSEEHYWYYAAIAESLLYDVSFHARADVIFCDVLPAIADVWRVLENVPRDYEVEVIDLEITPEESIKRASHAVRGEDINRMAAAWERWG